MLDEKSVAALPHTRIDVETDNFVRVIVKKSQYKSAVLSLHKAESGDGISVEITSESLPQALLRKRLHPKCVKAANEAGPMAALTVLHDAVVNNLLIGCTPEIRRIRAAVAGREGVSMGMNDTSGLFKITLENEGGYRVTAVARVPDGYPELPVSVKLKKSTFPEPITRLFEGQLVNIAQRCCAGMSVEDALRGSNQQKGPRGVPLSAEMDADAFKAGRVYTPAMTNKHIVKMREDIKYLKKAAHLRSVNDARKKGDARVYANSTLERRDARRALRKDVARETAKEEALVAEMEALRAAKGLEDAPPNPSLEPCIMFVADVMMASLPAELCQGCGDRMFPGRAVQCGDLFAREDNGWRPMRLYCNHWYHQECLAEVLTKPPFKGRCPSCDNPIYHPKFSSDVKRLEASWVAQQARKREVEDVGDFLGLDDEFYR